MACCPVCGKSRKRLATHLRKFHNLFFDITQPSNLKEFVHLLRYFPLSAKDWQCILKNRKSINRFYQSDARLPPEVFQVLFTNFDKYRSTKPPKLVILNGLQSTQKTKVPCPKQDVKPEQQG